MNARFTFFPVYFPLAGLEQIEGATWRPRTPRTEEILRVRGFIGIGSCHGLT